MTCDHDWTIRFPGVEGQNGPFEVRPITMNLKQSRTDYDFCRAKLPSEVGEQMKPHTRYSDGAMYGFTRAEVCHNGESVQTLMLRPDWVEYGNQFTHIQLHDLQKSLASGEIDEEKYTVVLRDVYEMVLDNAANDLITDIDFSFLPDDQITRITAQNGRRSKETRMSVMDGSARVLDANNAIDFDEISPERAIARLNEKFRLKSWMGPDRTLHVGLPEANNQKHIAASGDGRVWRYKDPSISHGREPIRGVKVEGAWVDEPGIDINPKTWFTSGGGDVKAYGIAQRTDIDYGSTFTVKSTKAKKNMLQDLAEQFLAERMKQQNAGSIEIDPALSGTVVSKPTSLKAGDLLRLVPDDEGFDNPSATSGQIGEPLPDRKDSCGALINNEVYLVTEVEHNITESGEWQLHADVGMYPDIEIESLLTYFDPSSEEWVSANEANLNESRWRFEDNMF